MPVNSAVLPEFHEAKGEFIVKAHDPYLLVRNLGLVQRQAGVPREVAELVCAYARLCADSRKPLQFFDPSVSRDSLRRQFIYRWIVEKNPATDERFVSFLLKYARTMAARRLPVIFTTDHLAHKLGISKRYLWYIARNQNEFYREFRIPKQNGESRVITAPKGIVSTIQRWIYHRILSSLKPERSATAFVKGTSVVENARRHLGRRVVVRLDLKDFFPSITFRQVRKVFEKLGYPYTVAVCLANLCTLGGRLPQGSPTSPALSNLVCRRLDRRFSGLARRLRFRYTRYADDLLFSSNDPRLPSLIPFFKDIVGEEGFSVNEGKVRVMRKGSRQTVTGIVVNERPNLPRNHVRTLRAAAHALTRFGPGAVRIRSRRAGNPDAVRVLRGHASYLKMVNPRKGGDLLRKIQT